MIPSATRRSALTAALVAAALLLGGYSAGLQADGQYFNHLYCDNGHGECTGKVGEHVTLWISAPQSDEPGQPCNWQTTTSWDFTNGQVELPPGMALDPHNSLKWEGTPRQAGDWTFKLTLDDVGCTQGPDQADYGTREIYITIHIDP